MNGLAVLALSVEKGQDLRPDVAGDRIPEQQVQEVDHLLAFGVISEGVVQFRPAYALSQVAQVGIARRIMAIAVTDSLSV